MLCLQTRRHIIAVPQYDTRPINFISIYYSSPRSLLCAQDPIIYIGASCSLHSQIRQAGRALRTGRQDRQSNRKEIKIHSFLFWCVWPQAEELMWKAFLITWIIIRDCGLNRWLDGWMVVVLSTMFFLEIGQYRTICGVVVHFVSLYRKWTLCLVLFSNPSTSAGGSIGWRGDGPLSFEFPWLLIVFAPPTRNPGWMLQHLVLFCCEQRISVVSLSSVDLVG